MSTHGSSTQRGVVIALVIPLLWWLWEYQPVLFAPVVVSLELTYIWIYHGDTARNAMRYCILPISVKTHYIEYEHAIPTRWLFTYCFPTKSPTWRQRRYIGRHFAFWTAIIYAVYAYRSISPPFLRTLLDCLTVSMTIYQALFAMEWGPNIGSEPLQNLRHNPMWMLILCFEILASLLEIRGPQFFSRLEPQDWWYILCTSTFCLYLSAPRPPVMLAKSRDFCTTSERCERKYICQVCKTALMKRNLTRDDKSRKQHHYWKRNLRKEAEKGCRICATVWQYWKELPVTSWSLLFFIWRPVTKFTWTDDGTVLKIISQQTRELSRRSCKFRVKKIPNESEPGRLFERPITAVTWSAPSITLAREWLSSCSTNHSNCTSPLRDPKFWPTRMIRIMGEDASLQIRLDQSGSVPNSVQYATLSHCWGGEISTRLLQSNVEAFETEIPLCKLPKNFLHAIHIANDLGISYIWIDSLCIIQDSATDWNEEAPKMRSIYANSACNIASTDSVNSYQGLVHARDPRALAPECIDEDEGLYLFNETDPFGHVLYTRAWVMQELLLAPRTIHFGRSQIFWSCNGLRASEVFPKGMLRGQLPNVLDNHPASIFNAFDSNGVKIVLNARLLDIAFKGITKYVRDDGRMDMAKFPSNINERYWLSEVESGRNRKHRYVDKVDSALHPFNHWSILVESYTRMKLTQAGDRPVALAGLIALLRPHLGQYLGGIWRDFLPMELLWQTQITSTRPKQYRAPTWSWLSVEGPISHSRCLKNYMGETYMATVVEANVEFEDEDAIVKAQNGSLRLKGKLARGYWDGRGYKRELYTVVRGVYSAECPEYDKSGIHFEELESHTFPKIFFDEHQDGYGLDDDVYFFAIRRAMEGPEKGEWVDGLVLRKHGPHGEFVRVGIFSDFGCQRILPLFLSLTDMEILVV